MISSFAQRITLHQKRVTAQSCRLCMYCLRRILEKPRLHYVVKRSSSQIPRKSPIIADDNFFSAKYHYLAIPIVSLCLAIWQLKKKPAQEKFINDLKDKMESPPIPLPFNLEDLMRDGMEYTPIRVRGEFDYSKELYLGLRPEVSQSELLKDQKVMGVNVVTPFRLADRDLTIMVNRGWYSESNSKKEHIRKAGQVHGPVELVGLLRFDQPQDRLIFYLLSGLTDVKVVEGQRVYVVRQIDKFAEELATAPIYLDFYDGDMDKQPSAPKRPTPGSELKNPHLDYGLVLLVVAVFSAVIWSRYIKKAPKVPDNIQQQLGKKR